MLGSLALSILLAAHQTPESQFKKHSGDNIKIRQDFYQGADRYHKRLVAMAKKLPKSEREAVLASEKQAKAILKKADDFAQDTGNWGTIQLDTGAGAYYQLEEDYFNAVQYLRTHNKRFIKRARNHNGAKKWAQDLRVLKSWTKKSEFSHVKPEEAAKSFDDLSASWDKYEADLPKDSAVKNFLEWSLADSLDSANSLSD